MYKPCLVHAPTRRQLVWNFLLMSASPALPIHSVIKLVTGRIHLRRDIVRTRTSGVLSPEPVWVERSKSTEP